MAKIVAPNKEYNGFIGPVEFRDGKAETDNQAVISYAREHGYEVDGETREMPAAPDMPDPRDSSNVQLGTALRDAAVDPQEGDFLPPVNAGKPGPEGNPHGPNVVSPGIHGVGTGPIVPGPVGEFEEQDDGTHLVITNTDAQQERQATMAEQVFINNRDVPEVTAELGEANDSPAPTTEQVAADKDRQAETSTAGEATEPDPGKAIDPAGTPVRPARNDSKAAWADYARARGATEDELESATKTDLINKYGG